LPGSTPKLALPYPLPADAVTDYPALGQSLAQKIEGLGGAVKLWDSTEAGVVFPVSSIITPAIPQTYKHLLLAYGNAASDSTSGQLALRFNAFATNYRYQYLQGAYQTPGAGEGYSLGYMLLGPCGPSTSGAYGGAGLALIGDYANVVGGATPNLLAIGSGFFSAASQQYNVQLLGGMYAGGAYAVTSLTILATAGNIRRGRFTLWGIG